MTLVWSLFCLLTFLFPIRVSAGKIKMVETQREMKCGKCGNQWPLYAKVERDFSFPEVSVCPSEEGGFCSCFSVVFAFSNLMFFFFSRLRFKDFQCDFWN